MANPKVQKILDKTKAFFTNHGEKLAVAFGGMMFVVGSALALTKPTIQITPQEVATNAESAEKNLNQPQSQDDILTALNEAGIKDLNFAASVKSAESDTIDPAELKLKHKWVTLEPGAGLIRDTPKLLPIEDVFAMAGRGGSTLFETDEKGERIPDDGSDDTEKSDTARGGRRGRGGEGMGFGLGGEMKQSSREKQEEEARFRRQQEERSRSLAGNVNEERLRARDKAREEAKKKDGEKTETAETPQGPFKEKLKGVRWAAVTGILDNKALRDNYAKALRKDFAEAAPNFHRVDLERQELNSDGTWSDWQEIDYDKNYLVLDNLTETDEELVPQENILETIVDPLPFLLNGAYGGVHVASLVPKDKREIKRPDPKDRMAMGGMGGMGGMGMMMGGRRGGSGGGDEMGGMGMMGGGRGGMGMMGGMGGDDYAGFLFGGGTGAAEDTNFPKTDAEDVMVRAFDFTVDPDKTYRYRARINVINPNYQRDDVNPGVDTASQYLMGPWSEQTNPVYVPSDVAPYLVAKAGSSTQGAPTDQLQFDVVAFNPEDGMTVVRQFPAIPGMIIGEPATCQIPAHDGSGAKTKTIDFTSRQIVLATKGGQISLAPLEGRGSITMPAMAFVMKPDGTLVVRNEAKDLNDPDLKFTRQVYAEELKKSDKARERGDMNMGMGMGMGMGGMGGDF